MRTRVAIIGGGLAGLCAASLQLKAGNSRRLDLSRDPAKGGEGAQVAANPIRQRLRPARLRIGQVGRAQGGHKDLRLADLARGAVDDAHRLPGVIGEQALAGGMELPHGEGQPPPPCCVQIAEPAVAISLQLGGPVFLPKQQKGDAGTA